MNARRSPLLTIPQTVIAHKKNSTFRMHRITLIIVLIFFISPTFCQSDKVDLTNFIHQSKERKIRNIIGFIPSKADAINGLAIGWLELGAYEDKKDSVIINGVYSNISPLQFFVGAISIPYLIISPFNKDIFKETFGDVNSVNKEYENRINGVSLSFLEGSDRYVVNGLQVSVLFHNMYKLHGFSATIGASFYSSFNGLMISGLFNNTKYGKGLQIGLINRSYNLTGLQIGLWNRIGNRSLPIINMRFKKQK
jgi:hypothetical protein